MRSPPQLDLLLSPAEQDVNFSELALRKLVNAILFFFGTNMDCDCL